MPTREMLDLTARCRRQSLEIDFLAAVMETLRRMNAPLRAPNADLRAENARPRD